ncbi:plexin domain-containing protein 2 [Anopheles nili]|uniref:plexin domain-containing protein 2 n=1 Tax=Anopheles nili TaxID=185578 RepID=UPI00237B4D82|nr:plexin domain-containing protein 2 [Anopheles nili]
MVSGKVFLVSRKYMPSDMTPLESSFPVPISVPPPIKAINETHVAGLDSGGSALSRSVVPLDESKKSLSKLKLLNENLNGKKVQNGGINLSEDSSHLLGYNGTGQRKEITTTDDEIMNKVTVSSLNKTLGTNEQTTVKTFIASKSLPASVVDTVTASTKLQQSSSRDAISDTINIDAFERTEAELNKTLQDHNVTKAHEDNHLYYKSTWSTEKSVSDDFWKKITSNLTVNGLLSNSHRRATTMLLSFDFPFYGFPIRNITIASGGFLYTGDYVHSWLASTQYIAPLMANFDTALSNSSLVKYRDDGETFIVVWENVILQDRQNNGTFTFSVTLNKSGDIVFAYKNIPINIMEIFENSLMKNHPVKIGLSDAYIIDKTIMRTKQKTIYEYHRVNFGQTEVKNDTIITLTALPTCFSFKDCESCITHEGADFECLWCPTINRCSTGTDRKRQDWIHKGCETTIISETSSCPAIGQKGNNYGDSVETTTKMTVDNVNNTNNTVNQTNSKPVQNIVPNKFEFNGTSTQSGIKKDEIISKAKSYHTADIHESSHGLLVSLLIVIMILFSSGCWVLYAYRNPHTKSGQLLIRIAKFQKYRPNRWLWRRGEARYTAATIHM